MAFILDGAVILIFIVTCIVGYVRGFFKYLIYMLSAIIAAAVALWASAFLAEPVYERYLEKDITAAVHRAAENIDPRAAVKSVLEQQGLQAAITDEDIDHAAAKDADLATGLRLTLEEKGADTDTINNSVTKLENYMYEQLPERMEKAMEAAGVKGVKLNIDRNTINDFVKKSLQDGVDRAADLVAERVIKPMVVTVLRVALFVICFAAVSLVFRLVIFILGVIPKGRELRAADRFGGLALGAMKGALYCFLGAFLICTLINVTNDGYSVLNSSVCEETYLFRWFFDFLYK